MCARVCVCVWGGGGPMRTVLNVIASKKDLEGVPALVKTLRTTCVHNFFGNNWP